MPSHTRSLVYRQMIKSPVDTNLTALGFKVYTTFWKPSHWKNRCNGKEWVLRYRDWFPY